MRVRWERLLVEGRLLSGACFSSTTIFLLSLDSHTSFSLSSPSPPLLPLCSSPSSSILFATSTVLLLFSSSFNANKDERIKGNCLSLLGWRKEMRRSDRDSVAVSRREKKR